MSGPRGLWREKWSVTVQILMALASRLSQPPDLIDRKWQRLTVHSINLAIRALEDVRKELAS